MVERVPWMSPIHYEILKHFEEHDIWESPRDLAKNIDYSRRYTAGELQKLHQIGLFEKEGQTYRLTDRGRAFLAGDLDADELPEPED
ncbi:MAG: MarR family transcriptional regulator [Halobacteriaceae archaeon]